MLYLLGTALVGNFDGQILLGRDDHDRATQLFTAALDAARSDLGSPSPSPSSTSRASSSPSASASASPPPLRPGGGPWTPVALIGGTGAGAVLITLGAVRASSLAHRRRGRAWVRKHMRAVAGQAGSVSAGVQERPGAPSISVGLEPHPDPLGQQQDEEAGQ